MFLDSNRKLVAVLTTAKTTLDLSVTADIVDLTSTTTSIIPLQAYTNGTTPVDIIPSPTSPTIRKVNGLAIYGRDTASKVLRIYQVDATPTTGLITAGSFVVGRSYQIVSIGTTDFTLIGASANTVGVIFDATGAGTGTGTASTAYQQIDMTLQIDDVLGYTDTNGWYTTDVNGNRKFITSTALNVANTWTAQQTFTQSPIVPSLPFNDSSTSAANTAFVQSVEQLSMATMPLANITGGTFSFASLGSGCTLTYTVTAGAISAVTAVAAGGSGYAVGDCLLVTGGNYDSVIRVATLSGSAVATVTILYGGTGYSNGTAVSTARALSDPFKWRLSGTLTSNATFILPNGTYLTASDQYIIANNTTGAFTVSFFVSNGLNATTGTGVTVAQGTGNNTNTFIETDGLTDVWFSSSATGNFIPLSITTNGTGTGLTINNSNSTTGKQAGIAGSVSANSANVLSLSLTSALSGGASTTTMYGFQNQCTFTPSVTTNIYGFTNVVVFNSSSAPSNINSSFASYQLGASALGGTIGTVNIYLASSASINAAATTNITTTNIFNAGNTTQGALQTITNVYVFRGQQASGTGRWNLYCDGSAINHLSGALLIGSTTDDTVNKLQVTGSIKATTGITSIGPTSGIGYGTGAGGTVTQITSRTTGVTINKVSGAITLVSAAGSATWQTFTVTNSAVAATDTISVNQKSGTDLNMIHVTAVAAGSFNISFATTGGTTTEQPVFNFNVIKGVAA